MRCAGPLLTLLVAILLALLRFLHGRLALRCLRPGCLLLMLRHPLRRSLCLVLGHPLLGWLRRMRGSSVPTKGLCSGLALLEPVADPGLLLVLIVAYEPGWSELPCWGETLAGSGPLHVPTCLLRRLSGRGAAALCWGDEGCDRTVLGRLRGILSLRRCLPCRRHRPGAGCTLAPEPPAARRPRAADNGSSGFAVPAAALRPDIDCLSIAAGIPAAEPARVPRRDPRCPIRVDADPMHRPNAHPSAVPRPNSTHGNTRAAPGSNAPGCAG